MEETLNEKMEPIKHNVHHEGPKAGVRKDEHQKKGKWLDDLDIKRWNGEGLCELELNIRMEVGLIGKTGGKEERKDGEKKAQFKTLGHDTNGQRTIRDGLKMRPASSEEMVKEKVQEQWKNESPLKGIKRGHVIMKALPKEGNGSQFDVSDYLVLVKSLHINLPKGVLNPEVIRLSNNADIIQKAQDIVTELENFKLQFNSSPRLGCREVKNSLALKNNKKILEMAVMVFFEKRKDSEETLRKNWMENKSNTVCGFRLRHKYKTTAISTPAMYATTQTRSWKKLEVGNNLANICKGVTVHIHDIENREYCDESALWTTSSSPKRFGKYFQNPADELECLKFFHDLAEFGNHKNVRYTRNTKVDFGFLSGRLDFLAEVTDSKANVKANQTGSDKIVIECKGTTGDMVGKLFTKPSNGGRRAQLNETHEYCYQVQAYMYILNRSAKQTQGFTSDRAVMVVRHYHSNGQEPRDFYWNFLEKNEAVQQQIEELCAFCQKEVLACFLAVLNLMFQKET